MEKKTFETLQFPKIIHEQLKTNFSGYYDRDDNKIMINISPCSFAGEYEFYGLRGLIRDLTATVIHELTHWATTNMNGHGDKRTLRNTWRTRRLLECDLWTARIHWILYDLQRKEPYKTYFNVKGVQHG